MNYLIQQFFFVFRVRYYNNIVGFFRKTFLISQGMKIGSETVIPKLFVSWPHQVSIGKKCLLEHGINFKFDGIWKIGPSIRIENNVFIGAGSEFNIRKSICIGSDSLIASGCKFIDHDHGILLNDLMRKQHGVEKSIIIGENVWLGCNVIVLKGVEIASGAIVAAGAVVNKSIGPNEIWAGVPAKKIGERKQ